MKKNLTLPAWLKVQHIYTHSHGQHMSTLCTINTNVAKRLAVTLS